MNKLKVALLSLVAFIAVSVYAQHIDLHFTAHVLKDISVYNYEQRTQIDVPAGCDISFNRLACEERNTPESPLRFILQDTIQHVEYKLYYDCSDIFQFEYNNIQDFWDIQTITKVLYHINKNGYQYDMRKGMEEDALLYLSKVKSVGEELDDPYLRDYIQRLALKIYPHYILDGRVLNFNVQIQESQEVNARTFPNGTIVLTTGLLSVLHTEEELTAILAHEIAHLVLDHSVMNVNKVLLRQKRHNFWVGALTGLTAVTEGIAAARTGYLPGMATWSVATLSSALGSKVIDYLGMKYNHKQEFEADRVAVQILKILGYDSNAMSSVLNRIKVYSVKQNDWSYMKDSPTHPALQERIEQSGQPQDCRDREFEVMVSRAVSNAAILHYRSFHFNQCLSLVSQNISNRVANSDDYVLRAHCTLALKDTPETNKETLYWIDKARQSGIVSAFDIARTEIIAHLRLGHKEQAVRLLQSYIVGMKKKSEENLSDRVSNVVQNEIKWAQNMLLRLQAL